MDTKVKKKKGNAEQVVVKREDGASIADEGGIVSQARDNANVSSSGSSSSSSVLQDQPPPNIRGTSESATVRVQENQSPVTMASFMSMLPVPVLNLESDTLEEDFKLFKFAHEQRMTAGKVPDSEVEIRGANFLGSLPPAAQLIVMNYDFAKAGKDKHNPDDVIAVICAVRKKKLSRIVARNRFLNRTMRQGETSSDFKAAITQLADQCGYDDK
jgi:hypothetical protein